MGAGKLDRRIQLQASTPTQGTSGQLVDSWSTVATVWAEYMPEQGSESFQSDQRTHMATVKFRIRFRNDVDPKLRVVFETRQYNITDVAEDGARKEYLLLTTTVHEVKPGS